MHTCIYITNCGRIHTQAHLDAHKQGSNFSFRLNILNKVRAMKQGSGRDKMSTVQGALNPFQHCPDWQKGSLCSPAPCMHTHTRRPPPGLLCALHACALTVTVLYSHVARSMQIRFTERACTVLQTHRDMVPTRVILGDHYSPLKFRIAGGAQMDFYLSVITSLRSEL